MWFMLLNFNAKQKVLYHRAETGNVIFQKIHTILEQRRTFRDRAIGNSSSVGLLKCMQFHWLAVPKKRWRMYCTLLPEYLANLTQPNRLEAGHIFLRNSSMC